MCIHDHGQASSAGLSSAVWVTGMTFITFLALASVFYNTAAAIAVRLAVDEVFADPRDRPLVVLGAREFVSLGAFD